METGVAKLLRVCLVVAAVFAIIAVSLMSCSKKNGVLTEIVLTPSIPSVACGYSLQLNAQGMLSDGVIYYMTSLTWSSDNPDLAQVNANGLVTASTGTTGTVWITATENDSHKNITGRVQLEVAPIQSIAVIPANPGMAINTAHQFHAVATLATTILSTSATQDLTSSLTSTLSSLIWTMSSLEVATVVTPTLGIAVGGLVTAGTVTGQTDVIATDPISGKVGSTQLMVTATPLASIAVTLFSDPTGTSVTTGSSSRLVATATYGDLTTLDRTTSMTWTSLNPDLATMSTVTDVLVTAGTTTGTITITATDPITAIVGTKVLTIN